MVLFYRVVCASGSVLIILALLVLIFGVRLLLSNLFRVGYLSFFNLACYRSFLNFLDYLECYVYVSKMGR